MEWLHCFATDMQAAGPPCLFCQILQNYLPDQIVLNEYLYKI